MSKNLQSPTKLTEFAPLQQEEKPQSVGQFISKWFKSTKTEDGTTSCDQEVTPTWTKDTSESSSESIPSIYPVDLNEGRSLPNVLKRISNLLALKTNNLQDYADTELKQYWMPDSVSKECYECSEKFTTFRRRHHCRVCGQIFCSQCCNQQIPGKIFGCTGDLRVCTYCCKIVLSYLQSSNFGINLSADLKALQENLQSRFGDLPSDIASDNSLPSNSLTSSDTGEALRRKISVGYQEEKFASGSSSSAPCLTSEEKCKALQNSISLRNLFEEICKPITGLNFTSHKYRLRTYPKCFLGSELVDWLICQQKAKTRVQAATLSQALLEGSYIESFSEPCIFIDGHIHYRKGDLFNANSGQTTQNFEAHYQDEPSWVHQHHDSSSTDSESEQISPPLATSNSYMLALNVEASSVYLSRPLESPSDPENHDIQACRHEETTVVRPSEQRELAPESGWFNASTLREENGEKEAYDLLSEAHEQHEQSLVKQLLCSRGLSTSWSEILLPLVRTIVATVRPDKNHDAIELDIRNYVQFKKIPEGGKEDTALIGGIVFTKNVAHRDMAVEIDNPRILLLQCSIVYQRTEGRLMSLEPVMMQEHEYLRHVAARIVALQPHIVVVHKNVSRLAQDMLRQHKITLIHNVKSTVLERLARCTEADLVTAVDAHIGRPNLGTCKKFYLKTYYNNKGSSKTLMFFEGLVHPNLGATVLLRGASKTELIRVKKIASFLLFTSYNWRLEKSFLMDQFALPPNSRIEFLDDSRDNSPLNAKPKLSLDEVIENKIENSTFDVGDSKTRKKSTEIFTDPLQCVESKKIIVESVNDHSDPLQSYDENMKNKNNQNQAETLTVTEVPLSNGFKKYLDDTILCISPYVIFPVPYLETDIGRKCKLRRFFHKDMYYSEQFEMNIRNKKRQLESELTADDEEYDNNAAPLHPFLTTKIINIDNKTQHLLSHFRACGGQYAKKEILCVNESTVKTPRVSNEKSRIDALDPLNHQRLAVLFYSFSHESQNAPAFCVNPWVVYMDFYGRNDIPIGCFLERYCFRASYGCPSKSCMTPMEKHIRRFVHNSGSVTVTLNNFTNEFAEEDIVMWSWCSKCQSVSPVVPLSADSWSYSFAKYLEMRFYGEIFNRRGQNPCRHSLQHDHIHYFGFKNYVATFKYSTINVWEISLPSPVIEITYDVKALRNNLIEEAKLLSQKGHEWFSAVQDKITILETEELEAMRQAVVKEQANFKQRMEELQLKLTSPTVECKEFIQASLCQTYWKIYDNATKIKMTIAELVDNWNSILSETIRKSDKKKEKSLVSEQETPSNEASGKTILERDIEKSENIEEVLIRQLDSSTLTQVEESTDSKRDIGKKEKSVKNILDKLLSSPGHLNLIQNPFALHEHYNLPPGVYGPLPVFEFELSSIIAYALNSCDYKKSLEDLMTKKGPFGEQSPSPISKRRNNGEKDKSDEDKNSGLLGFLRNKDSKSDLSNVQSPTALDNSDFDQPSLEKPEDAKKSNLEIQFQDSTCSFFVRIYLADKFAILRGTVLPIGDEAFIRSISRSVQWNAMGGKSRSSFAKTSDDRFILKEMTRTEVQIFLDLSANYFAYMHKCHSTQQPTLLGKIVGIYQIEYKNSANIASKKYLLVMENLFYNRNVSQKFDLKGSMRNRLVVPDNQEGEIVLLDENLLKMTCDNPLYILPHSKEVLLAAIQNDTEFLSTQSVMDYSLLVGLDPKNKELVLGIIDYIRTFTWDKRLETMVKKTGLLGGQGKLPTIISPQEYQKRFIEAMHRYFLEVPDHYAGLGKGLEV